MLDEGKSVTMLVKAVKSAMGNDGRKASAVEAAMGNGCIASTILDEGNPVKMLVREGSAMGNASNASAVKTAMGMAALHRRCSMKALPSRCLRRQ